MLSVDEALEMVLCESRRLAAVTAPVAQSLGLVLAEEIKSDLDSPPWDKSMVDGYALRTADLTEGNARLKILEEVVAGAVPQHAVGPGEATRIMTGAPLPSGADAVVMIEKTSLPADSPDAAGHDAGFVEIRDQRLAPGQNILRQGSAMRRGDVVLCAGREIRPVEIGLLSEVGRTTVRVYPRPRVAVLSTGNELVPPDHTPAPGQIRNSNGPMLEAAVNRAGAIALPLGIARDDRDELRRTIAAGLAADALLLSGGVSAGVLDLVPAVLAELAVEQVFHKVRLKPGKPLWFGVRRHAPRETLVFGLPGNPVSSLVCFELFVRPALARLAGREAVAPPPIEARLARAFTHRGDRPTYHPALLRTSDDGATVEPLAWQGSADLRGLAQANALAHFAAGDRQYAEGETVDVRPFL